MLIKAVNSIGAGVRYELQAGENLSVGQDVSVVSTDVDAITGAGTSDVSDNKNIRVAGLVQGGNDAIYFKSSEEEDHVGIVVEKTGLLIAGSQSGNGIRLADYYGTARIVNHGTIIGQDGVWLGQGDHYEITNTGTILATRFGIIANDVAVQGEVIFHNSGRLVGAVVAFDGGASRDSVLNSGVITGDIWLYNNNDLYDGRGGRVIGTVFGGEGNDRFIAGGVRDVFDGGTGTDVLDFRRLGGVHVALDGAFANTGAAKGDVYLGFENIQGSGTGNDWLRGNDRTNFLFGNGGNDRLWGGNGSDALIGGAGVDWIFGGLEGDVIKGDIGRDRLAGGAGADAFHYQSFGEGGDVITDFSGGGGQAEAGKDFFQLRAQGFGLALNSKGSFNPAWFHAGKTNQAHDANDRFIFRTTDTTLWFDADGTGGKGPILLADLQAGAQLSAFNFDLI